VNGKKKIFVKKGSPNRPIYLGEPPKEVLEKIAGKIGQIAPHLQNKFTKDELIQIAQEGYCGVMTECACNFCACDCVCWCPCACDCRCDCGYCLCEPKMDVTTPIILKELTGLKEKVYQLDGTIKNIETQFGDIKLILSKLQKRK